MVGTIHRLKEITRQPESHCLGGRRLLARPWLLDLSLECAAKPFEADA